MVSPLDKPHILLDLSEGLAGNSPGSLSTISENIRYVLGFSGKFSSPLPDRLESSIHMLGK